jgi:hypothetical protein
MIAFACSIRATVFAWKCRASKVYNEVRTHVSLGKDAPFTRPIERYGNIVAYPILGGLHHRYARI